MISVKKVNGTIVTKTVLPSVKEMNIVKANEKIAELQSQLETKEDKTPSTSTYAVSTEQGCFNQFSVDNDHEALAKNLAGIKSEPVTIKPVQERYTITDGFSSHRKNKTEGIRVRPEQPSNYTAKDFTYAVEPEKFSKTVAYSFPSHNYFLMYENGKAYYQTARMPVATVLIKNHSGNASVVETNIKETPIHLTKADVDSLVKANVSKDNLFKQYTQLVSADKVCINFNTATAVWN